MGVNITETHEVNTTVIIIQENKKKKKKMEDFRNTVWNKENS